ncbi:hypothetical protein MIND_00832600 [Mycena indigotica]|uniref:Uncharacterized protein n=1 Tax=Mycena indigotica TaxID=2126181 RepID=A0A8H6W236_9AGAR|nr:uncharacterized protein MIND_00832600 [Mycena indigotica]KAF7298848.1 hypothetical protein MIND_00832600 [Mycena indigotica]
MAPPLAGRPPFATDEPDSVYENSPQPRRRAPQPQPPTDDRNSTYDVYDNYLTPGDSNNHQNRNSGIEGLGMGFMNGNMDDAESSDDEDDMLRSRMASSPKKPLSKNAALAAATGASPSKQDRLETPPPQYAQPQQQQQRKPMPGPSSPPPIAAPRPGYAAPIAALSQMNANGNVAKPEPAAALAGRNNNPNGLRIVAPPPIGTPSPTSSPHPLGAPVTPITPVFARPQRTATMESNNSVSFSETKGLIMRGDSEETLLTRGRGEKGDQFWRRFSMVAKDPSEKGPSQWLQKTQNGTSKQRRWVWIVGIILIILAAGGIGLGVYVSEQAKPHYRPDAIGGSANEGTRALSSTKGGSGPTSIKGALGGATSVLHVKPTNTVARRAPVPQITSHARRNKRMARLEPEGAL